MSGGLSQNRESHTSPLQTQTPLLCQVGGAKTECHIHPHSKLKLLCHVRWVEPKQRVTYIPTLTSNSSVMSGGWSQNRESHTSPLQTQTPLSCQVGGAKTECHIHPHSNLKLLCHVRSVEPKTECHIHPHSKLKLLCHVRWVEPKQSVTYIPTQNSNSSVISGEWSQNRVSHTSPL